MDYTTITDYQLYEIIQNEKLNHQIRQDANSEFNKRKLSVEVIQQLVAKYDAQFTPAKAEELKLQYKILLVIFPLFIDIHSLIAGRMLAKGEKEIGKTIGFTCV